MLGTQPLPAITGAAPELKLPAALLNLIQYQYEVPDVVDASL